MSTGSKFLQPTWHEKRFGKPHGFKCKEIRFGASQAERASGLARFQLLPCVLKSSEFKFG